MHGNSPGNNRPPFGGSGRGPDRGPGRGPNRGPSRGPSRGPFQGRGGPRQGPGGFGNRRPPGPGGFGNRGRYTPQDDRPPKVRTRLVTVHEDDELIVVSKPAGVACSPPPGVSRESSYAPNVFDMVKRKAKGRVRIVNRIEKVASGLVVIARTDRAFESLSAQLRGGDARRVATAIVERNGHWEAGGEASLKHTLIGGRQGPERALADHEQIADTGSSEMKSKPVRMLVRVEAVAGERARLRLFMQSALPGQAPLQLQSYGSPICELPGRPGIALHHGELTIKHPATGAPLRLKIDHSDAFGELMGESPKSTPSWEPVADWYDNLAEERSDHHTKTIHPGVAKLLGSIEGERVLDIACGQGALARALLEQSRRPTAGSAEPLPHAEIVGIDSSQTLIEAARERTGDERARFHVLDARELGGADLGMFDAATCVMAAMNVDPIGPVLDGCAERLKAGGRLVMVILHPAFRIPQHSSWSFEGEGSRASQRRVVARYLSPIAIPITMNPGEVASGAEPVRTTTHHRPLGDYMRALASAGFAVDAIEEWASERTSEPGPRAAAENLARREIPMFMALRAIRSQDGSPR